MRSTASSSASVRFPRSAITVLALASQSCMSWPCSVSISDARRSFASRILSASLSFCCSRRLTSAICPERRASISDSSSVCFSLGRNAILHSPSLAAVLAAQLLVSAIQVLAALEHLADRRQPERRVLEAGREVTVGARQQHVGVIERAKRAHLFDESVVELGEVAHGADPRAGIGAGCGRVRERAALLVVFVPERVRGEPYRLGTALRGVGDGPLIVAQPSQQLGPLLSAEIRLEARRRRRGEDGDLPARWRPAQCLNGAAQIAVEVGREVVERFGIEQVL